MPSPARLSTSHKNKSKAFHWLFISLLSEIRRAQRIWSGTNDSRCLLMVKIYQLCFLLVNTAASSWLLQWLMWEGPNGCYCTGTGAHTLQLTLDSTILMILFVCSRVIASLQKQMVMADFKPAFRKKLQDFFQTNCVPVELKKLKNRSVCVSVRYTPSPKCFLSFVLTCVAACVSVRGPTACWRLC